MALCRSAFLSCMLVALTSAQPTPPETLKGLYDARQWFKLRDALDRTHGPPLYSGAVAVAFKDVRAAEEILNRIVRQDPTSDEAREAYEHLAHLYVTSGQYNRFRRAMEAKWASLANPDGEQKERFTHRAFLPLPDQIVASRRPSRIRAAENLWVPCTVNTTRVEFFLDTGAGISAVSESEAIRLKLRFNSGESDVGSSTGRRMGVRTAVADQLVIGGAHLRNVSFIVLPDRNEPWVHLPEGRRGLLGVPVLIALGRLTWARTGTIEIGANAWTKHRKPNLCFVDDHLAVRAVIRGQDVSGTLDTGAETTDLYSALLSHVPALRSESSASGTTEVRGVGGSDSFQSIILPDLTVALGGFETSLRPAHVLLKQVGPASCVGNFGLDLLKQADFFQIDFENMTLSLRRDRYPF